MNVEQAKHEIEELVSRKSSGIASVWIGPLGVCIRPAYEYASPILLPSVLEALSVLAREAANSTEPLHFTGKDTVEKA